MAGSSWFSMTTDFVIPTALAIGAGFFTFTLTSPRISNEELGNNSGDKTLLEAFSSDIRSFQQENVEDETCSVGDHMEKFCLVW